MLFTVPSAGPACHPRLSELHLVQEVIGGGAIKTFGCDLNSEKLFLNSQGANGARVKEFGILVWFFLKTAKLFINVG